MKIRHLLLVAILTLTTVATAVAQAPLSFTYQAVVRNSSGRLVSNATVGVKISIVRDSATGQVVYSGVQTPRTNANGLFTLVIGDSQNGIDTITWRNGPYFLKSEVDPNGGSNYTLTSVQQMLSVPYALHAHTVDNVIGGVNFIERQVLSMNGDTVFLTGGSYVVLPPSFSGDYNDLTNKPTIPTNVSAFYNDAGYLTSATLTETQVLSIRHDTVFLTGGSFVKLPAGFSGNYNDLTNKPTNVSAFYNDSGYLTSATLTETQVLSIRHDTVFLTGGSFVKLPAGFSGNYNDLTNKPTIPTVPTNVSAFTNDAGYLTSYTETQVLSIRHDTVFLTGGSFVKLPAGFSGNYNDLTNKPTIPTVPTNVSAFTNDAGYLTNATLTETQVLSISHDTVFLTGGSFVKLPAGFSGNYNDLTNKPTIPTVPTNVSAFTNDAGYLTNATLAETQVLTIRHDTIFLTGGSFVALPSETQNLSDVATNNDSVNSQIKNLYDPTDSMDAVNLRTLGAIISRLDSIITYQNRVIDTLRNPSNNTVIAPTGALPGLFKISINKRVYFSKGNLQWSATGGGNSATTHKTCDSTAAGTWRFAEHQYDYIGSDNSNISGSYSGWIDLFGWGTSGRSCIPFSTSISPSYYQSETDISDTKRDWGLYNAISNGGNKPGMWRVLTKSEWDYLLNVRYTDSGIRYCRAKVNGKKGIIILPDNWDSHTYALSNVNTHNASHTSNIISSTQWITLENAGAVFLPDAGYREGTTVSDINNSGWYWTSTPNNNYGTSSFCIRDVTSPGMDFWASVPGGGSYYNTDFGFSVRLVKDE
jgi:hypothetical protein